MANKLHRLLTAPLTLSKREFVQPKLGLGLALQGARTLATSAPPPSQEASRKDEVVENDDGDCVNKLTGEIGGPKGPEPTREFSLVVGRDYLDDDLIAHRDSLVSRGASGFGPRIIGGIKSDSSLDGLDVPRMHRSNHIEILHKKRDDDERSSVESRPLFAIRKMRLTRSRVTDEQEKVSISSLDLLVAAQLTCLKPWLRLEMDSHGSVQTGNVVATLVKGKWGRDVFVESSGT
ncbi:hypothetical protein ZIOFF_035299 [Zingiber officinale]|uniref:Uncharacterized protein n=1 Tax=Zingiber officinale TaxID=94328 RepID=A0A8J5G8P1_ZINOF|nr:hypothetical protein ZIOFF_035299 [Zingiber officinale]